MGQAKEGLVLKHTWLAAALLLGRERRSDATTLDLSLFSLCVSPLMPALGRLALLLPAVTLPAGDARGPWLLLAAVRSPALQWICLSC